MCPPCLGTFGFPTVGNASVALMLRCTACWEKRLQPASVPEMLAGQFGEGPSLSCSRVAGLERFKEEMRASHFMGALVVLGPVSAALSL